MASLALVGLALVCLVIVLRSHVWEMGSAIALLLIVVAGVWWTLVGHGLVRVSGAIVGIAALAGAIAFLTGQVAGLAIVVVLVLAAARAAHYALGTDLATLRARTPEGEPVPAARHGVLIMNPKSGGGKVGRFNLEDEARRRGIQPVLLGPGDDLLALAEQAVADGADVIGMAGGDGSQALVASVAAKRGVAHVCVPAGTRNHLALDIGLDRDDVVGALDAYGPAVERRVDLGLVGDRVFVNNVSLGVYAEAVQRPGYRESKLATLQPQAAGSR